MKRDRSGWGLRDRTESMDRRFVALIAEHIDLLLAVTTLGIALWSVLAGEFEYIPALAIAGAISFFVGFIPSLCISFLFELLFVLHGYGIHHHLVVAVVMVEVFGYGCVAWLGFRHREQQRAQKEMIKHSNKDPVMPWVVANEVRTSLAAIRFLLFPLHSTESREDAPGDAVRQATAELQRLEQIFSNMEKSTVEGPRSKARPS